MSKTEVRKGRLEQFYLGESLEEDCQAACICRGVNEMLRDTWEETLDSTAREDFMILNGKLYRVVNNDELDPGRGFAEVTENEDGSIDYLCMWYNGGGSLEEVIEDKLLER